VDWALQAATTWAHARGLPEDEVVDEALHAVAGAVRTHDGRTTLSEHIRRRVRGALLDATKVEQRRRMREVFLDDLEDDEATLSRTPGMDALVVGSPEESLLRHEAQAALGRAVEQLPPFEKRLYELRHREGLTWDEITAETGIPGRTARWYDRKIRDHLAEVLRTLDEDG
jgi:RNA polymerase sigma factor (sigma-70 family)